MRVRTALSGALALVTVAGITCSTQAQAQSIDTGFDLVTACITADHVLQGVAGSDPRGALGAGLCMGYIDGAVQAQALWADAKPFCVKGLKRREMVHSFATWAIERTDSIQADPADTFNAFMWERHACKQQNSRG
ncbi:Rap1a/Tai family immunity protein [Caballeronia sp. LZ025]